MILYTPRESKGRQKLLNFLEYPFKCRHSSIVVRMYHFTKQYFIARRLPRSSPSQSFCCYCYCYCYHFYSCLPFVRQVVVVNRDWVVRRNDGGGGGSKYGARALPAKRRTRAPVTPPRGSRGAHRPCLSEAVAAAAAAAAEVTTDATLARVRQCVRAYRCGSCPAPRFTFPPGNDNINSRQRRRRRRP